MSMLEEMNPPEHIWEVGSEFHWCDLPQPPFLPWPAEVRWYLLARHGIAALIQLHSAKKPALWLPSYFCPEVAEACRSICELFEYRDDPRWPEPDWSSLHPAHHDLVLAVNYFGVRSGISWQNWRVTHECFLVEDHTQDPFSPWCLNSAADYAVASLRKTMPIPDGAVIWSPRALELPQQPDSEAGEWSGSALKTAAMLYKTEYLRGQGGDELKSRFRDLQMRGEQRMRSSSISAVSPYSRAYIENGMPEHWRVQRLRNARYLLNQLPKLKYADLLFQEWPEGAVPFVLLLLFHSQNERDNCQACLQRQRIYCPVHWACQTENIEAIDLCARILSLPIDQRYAENEMERIAAALNAYAEANVAGAIL
jgi:hypothetical protein